MGFSANGVYSTTDVDSVNVFNGNLTLAIPVGSSYPVSERLSYSLTLVYNSSVWSYVPYQPDPDFQSGVPEPSANAGLGWTLTFGRLVPPGTPFDADPANDQPRWKLIEADGATHFFFDELHPDEIDGSDFFYTRDGAYLRMESISSAEHLVAYPDGTLYTYEDLGGDYWEVTKISNHFGDEVTVNRDSPLAWEITDNSGAGTPRTHTINFTTDHSDTALPGPMVSSVVLAVSTGTATYSFDYDEIFVERGCQDSVLPSEPYDETIKLPLLKQINLPEGEKYEMLNPGTPGTAAYETSCGGLPQGPSGRLSHLVLPTGGRVEWDYDGYLIPKVREGFGLRYSLEAGVAERRKYAADDYATPEGVWTYDNGPEPEGVYCEPPACNPAVLPIETRTVVVQPSIEGQPGSCTAHYFSADPQDLTWNWAWGLPFAQTENDGSGRFLSTEVWTSSAEDEESQWREVKCSGTKLRTRRVAYDKDPRDISTSDADANRNQRLTLERLVFEDDEASPGVARSSEVSYSNFDGLGHYRQAVTSGNFPGENVKTTITNFNPHIGEFGQGGYVQWDETKRWILGSYDATSVKQGTRTTHAEYCFDLVTGTQYPQTPHLERLRRLKLTGATATRNANDVLELFTKTGGNVTKQRYFGGDTQALDTEESICVVEPTGAPPYRITKVFQYGALKRQNYRDSTGAEMFPTYNVDLDAKTALPVTARDTAGLATTFTYDDLGRLRTQDPAAETATTYTYTPATGAGTAGFTPAKVTVKRDGGSSLKAEQQYLYDGFGRIITERRLNEDESTFAERDTEYNARGWKESVSEWDTTAKTVFSAYDPFGRATLITAPDLHQTDLAYTGVSRVERTVQVEQGGGENDVVTAETYDRFGRLHEVEEPVGGGTMFGYAYDEQDRLIGVDAGPTGGSTVQTRSFTYDGRGFLSSESHPEKGAVGGRRGQLLALRRSRPCRPHDRRRSHPQLRLRRGRAAQDRWPQPRHDQAVRLRHGRDEWRRQAVPGDSPQPGCRHSRPRRHQRDRDRDLRLRRDPGPRLVAHNDQHPQRVQFRALADLRCPRARQGSRLPDLPGHGLPDSHPLDRAPDLFWGPPHRGRDQHGPRRFRCHQLPP